MQSGAGEAAPGADRITSYNVCYTKLLRSVMVAKEGFVNDPFRGGRAVSDILAIRDLPQE